MSAPVELPGFTHFDFTARNYRHTVYKRGDDSQPGVLVIQELPGILPETIALAERLHRDGYTVYMPHLFGAINKPRGEILKNTARICVSLEFRVLANRRRSPVTDWLRALARHIQEATGGPIAAIGMCLSGGFVLTLMIDDSIAAPVMSQPSHADGMLNAEQRQSLGVPEADVSAAVERAKRENIPVLGLRFTHDVMCPRARFDHLEDLLGDNFRRIDIDSSLFNPNRIPLIAHAVLTADYVDEPGHPTRQAYETVVGFLQERLAPAH